MRRLITIPISHYCEKARWALERAGLPYAEERHVQGVHQIVARRAGGRKTVPVLLAPEGVFAESEEILAYADESLPEELRLFPAEPALRAEVESLSRWLDEGLGPDARRVMYTYMLEQRRLMLKVNNQGVPRWEGAAMTAFWPVVVRFASRELRIDPAGPQRGRGSHVGGLRDDRRAPGRRPPLPLWRPVHGGRPHVRGALRGGHGAARVRRIASAARQPARARRERRARVPCASRGRLRAEDLPRGAPPTGRGGGRHDLVARKQGRLAQLDLGLRLSREEEQERLAAGQRRLLALRLQLGGKLGDGRLGPPLCVLFEGWDASGKGGAIKRLVASLDPRHVRVATFAAPTPREKRHHFLWRFVPALPGWGGMSVLDRSWYGRVLVERVEEYATVDQWSRAYEEIVEFERMQACEGMNIVKFWLHISSEEQLKRFKRRESDPLKRWKISEDDWRNRGRREGYEEAVEAMLERTDHDLGRWQLIEAESKRYARVKVVETTIAEIERGMRKHGIEPLPVITRDP